MPYMKVYGIFYIKKGQKMRIIKKRIIEENREIFERCYKAQEELEKARKAIQAQVEPDALEYQEPMDYERVRF